MHAGSKNSVLADLRLARILAARDLQNRYAGSYAGAIWSIGVPLLYSLINVAVFSILMGSRMDGRNGGIPFSLFYFVPFSLWSLFTEVQNRSLDILKEYSYLINKIAFPVWVLPLVPMASALINQAIIFVIIAGLMISNGVIPAETAWLFLPIWLLSLLITLGGAYGVAAIAVYIPDLRQLIPVLLSILFWLTPILYPATLVQKSSATWARTIIMDWNPFYYLVETARLAVFGSDLYPWHYLSILAGCALFALAGGGFIFRKLQPGFADVL